MDIQVCIYDNAYLIRYHKITKNYLDYNYDLKKILNGNLLFGMNDKEIEGMVNRSYLQIYVFLKEVN